MLLSSATQAAHRLNARQHHRADDKTQHQVGDDRQRGGHHPTQPRAPVLDGMMQRRNTVNDYPRRRGTWPASRQWTTPSSGGERRPGALYPATAPAHYVFRQPVTHVVQLDDHPHQAIHPDSDQNRNPRKNKDLVKQRSFRHDAEGNGDNFRGQNKIGANRAFTLSRSKASGSRSASAARRCCRRSGSSLCFRASRLCSTFSIPSKQRNAPPSINNGVIAQG